MDVMTEVSVVNAIAGILSRSILNRPINSAAICCASAALPPLPNKITFPLFFKHEIILIADWLSFSDRFFVLVITSILSSKIVLISSIKLKSAISESNF